MAEEIRHKQQITSQYNCHATATCWSLSGRGQNKACFGVFWFDRILASNYCPNVCSRKKREFLRCGALLTQQIFLIRSCIQIITSVYIPTTDSISEPLLCFMVGRKTVILNSQLFSESCSKSKTNCKCATF